MHEFAIAQDIVSSLEQQLKSDFSRITAMEMEAGAFAGIVEDSLVFGLETLFAEKNLTGVRIRILQREAEALCRCGNRYKLNNVFDLCPGCGSAVREMQGATELTVKSVILNNENHEQHI